MIQLGCQVISVRAFHFDVKAWSSVSRRQRLRMDVDMFVWNLWVRHHRAEGVSYHIQVCRLMALGPSGGALWKAHKELANVCKNVNPRYIPSLKQYFRMRSATAILCLAHITPIDALMKPLEQRIVPHETS